MNFFDKPYVYGAKHKDEKIRINSRSGGVFTVVSDYILDCGGIVYGCVMENCVDATHKRAQTKEERDKMRGSKYIQSSINDTYNLVKKIAFLLQSMIIPCRLHFNVLGQFLKLEQIFGEIITRRILSL